MRQYILPHKCLLFDTTHLYSHTVIEVEFGNLYQSRTW